MRKTALRFGNPFETGLALCVFAVLLSYTFIHFVVAPYPGFYFNPSDGKILYVYVQSGVNGSLLVGDTLEQIGLVPWSNYKSNAEQSFFEGTRPGEIVPIMVRRNGERQIVRWKYPGFNGTEFWERFVNLWFLAYVFCFFGLITQLVVRPKDTRWRLMIAANYLTGLWLIFGSLSVWQIWRSSSLFHALTWLGLPLYLHLHWEFPRPLGRFPAVLWGTLYTLGSALALGELMHVFPRTLYFFGFLLMFAGSLSMLIAHFFKQPLHRREVGFLVLAILLAVLPTISLGIVGMSGATPSSGALALLALPIMPTAYFYVIYRRQLGGLELRANRLISIYGFLILFGAILMPVIGWAELTFNSIAAGTFFTLVITILAVLAGILVFPKFQALVEQRLLGIKLPMKNMLEVYSTRITTSTSLPSLTRLLQDELLPSLLVRQFAFYQSHHGSSKLLFFTGLAEEDVPDVPDFSTLMPLAGKYLSPEVVEQDQARAWIRLVLPLRIGDEVIGFWILGRRDPDDVYAQAEISMLQSLANQTAIALSNILQTERLTAMYQADINRYEEERLRLALDLHDSILNQMAALLMIMDDRCLTPAFQESYDGLTHRLREIVSDLRPPMLNYGLKVALDDLAENLMERNKDGPSVVVDLNTGEIRYPANVELHLYRILQEGCENALRHSGAARVAITGRLEPHEISLELEDDGVGFDTGQEVNLDTLLANKHFGLVGMIERAMLIGAVVDIHSAPSAGTRIRISWKEDGRSEA